MTTEGSSTSPTDAAAQFEWATVTNLVLIAIAMMVTIAVIWWGAKKARERKAIEREIAESNEASRTDTIGSSDVATAPAPVHAPPTPPLQSDDTPVVATAPFDAAPATIAVDLDTPPSPPADGADDLTRLKGVGPRLAARLGELGITRYADIADLTPADAEALDAQLGTFKGRLARDRLIEQAGHLARGDHEGFEAAFGRL